MGITRTSHSDRRGRIGRTVKVKGREGKKRRRRWHASRLTDARYPSASQGTDTLRRLGIYLRSRARLLRYIRTYTYTRVYRAMRQNGHTGAISMRRTRADQPKAIATAAVPQRKLWFSLCASRALIPRSLRVSGVVYDDRGE